VLKIHFVSVCIKCFGCFRGMLELFQMNVVKVDQNIVYIAMLYTYVTEVCSKCFICVFGRIIASVFIWMLHTFHTYIVSILSGYCVQWFSSVFHMFLQVFQKYVLSVLFVFRRMLQVLYLNVSKIDRVLYMLQCA
jgi:hypothetical protein